MANDNSLYDEEYCYECSSYGDDYYFNDDGVMICRCFECEFSTFKLDEDD